MDFLGQFFSHWKFLRFVHLHSKLGIAVYHVFSSCLKQTLVLFYIEVKSVYKHNHYCAAMSTPLYLQIAYRPSAAVQQLALHNHLEETILGMSSLT